MIALEFCWFDWGCWGDQIKAALNIAVNAILEVLLNPVLDSVSEALGTLLTSVAAFWIDIDTPTPDAGPMGTTVTWLHGRLWYFVFTAATVSLIVAGMRMAWERRGEPLREVLKSLLTLVVVMGLAVTVVTSLTQAGDRFSECVIASSITPNLEDPSQNPDQELAPPELPGGDFTSQSCNPNEASGRDLGRNLVLMLVGTSVATGTPLMGFVLAITLGLLAIVASLLQVMLMIVRNGMLVLLLGVLPLAAAATNTEMGRLWLKRCIAWLVAFLLYKPVAALIYAAALRLASTPIRQAESFDPQAEAIVSSITGFVMMVLALFALPALMRLLTPLVAAAAGSSLMPAAVGGVLGATAMKVIDKAAKGADVTGDSHGPSGARNAPATKSARGPRPGSQGGSGGQGPQGAPGSPGPASASAGGNAGASAGSAGLTGGSAAAGGPAAAAAGLASVAIAATKAVGRGVKDDVHRASGPSGSE